MPEKAIIAIKLVAESSEALNSQVEREILAESQIPWCAKIEKVEIKNDATITAEKIKG
jgi:hypothetical protein